MTFYFSIINIYCSFVTDLGDELEKAYNKGNIPIANVDTPRTADMTKRAIAIFASGSTVTWSDTVETQLGLYEKKKSYMLSVLAATVLLHCRHVPSNPLSLSMSLCPPFAPFFGFAGVASAVSCWNILDIYIYSN